MPRNCKTCTHFGGLLKIRNGGVIVSCDIFGTIKADSLYEIERCDRFEWTIPQELPEGAKVKTPWGRDAEVMGYNTWGEVIVRVEASTGSIYRATYFPDKLEKVEDV